MTRILVLVGALTIGCFSGGETDPEPEPQEEPAATYCLLSEPLTRACRAAGAGAGQLCDGKPTGDHVRASDISDFDVARLPGAWCATYDAGGG